MTNNYKIHIITTNATLKLSYRNGKFFKLEKLTGKFTDVQVTKIGFVIPPTEDKIQEYKAHWKNKVTYTLIDKKKSLFHEFNPTCSFYPLKITKYPPK